MTPAEEAVLAAARAYRDACDARAKASALASSLVVVGSRSASFLSASDAADAAGHVANDAEEALLSSALAMGLVDAPPVEAPTVAPARPWPDPEAYRALAREVYGEVNLPRDVPSAVAAWKALQDGQRVMCARGYQWTAHRTGGRLRFTMAHRDGRLGKTLEQPWYPCIVGKLPVWPIVIEAAEPVTC